MSYSFTSKDAFKTITFAIKDALGKSIKVADVRNAAASSEGFPSASEYLTALDDAEITLHKLEIPLDFEALMVIVEEEKPSAPYCFLYIDTTVHIIALNESGRADMRETAFGHENVCELSGFIKAMNARLGYKNADDFKKAGFARYMDEIALGLKPSSECLTEVNDPFQDPELINILLHQDYGTAGYLQALVAHLFNSTYELDN